MNLYKVAEEINRRLASIFLRDKDGRRPVHGGSRKFQEDPHWRDLILFYEYFHGDSGAGIGASHQTSWTGVVAGACTCSRPARPISSSSSARPPRSRRWSRSRREALRGPGRREGDGLLNARTLRSFRRHVLIYAGLIPFVAIALFPVFWMAITAFKQDADLYRIGQFPFWFYQAPTLEHFRLLFTRTYFVPQLVNTLLLSVCVVAITVVTAVPAGYALARMRLPGAGNIGIAIFCTYLVPGILLFIPLARVVGTLGLFDSWWALVVVYPTFTIPFCTWKMLAYFKTVPKEVEEAAWVDGCGLVGALVRVMVPLSRQGVIITSIFAFSLSMQEFLYAVVYVAPRAEKVVTVGLVTNLIRGDIFYWGSLMAGGLIVGLPIAILYSLVLEDFVQGLSGDSS